MNIETILNKLSSRKFWVAIAFGVVVLVGDELGFDLDADQIRNLTYVVLTYLGAQGVVDAVGTPYNK